jgi:TolB-like protein/Flp pilus assembly protein TadD
MAERDGMDGSSGGVASRTVFLSYASQDTEIANTVCRELEGHRIRCWIAPRDVAPGALYADAIVRAINEANVLLIVLSKSAVASSHVGREIERAASKHKRIIALRVDAAPLSPALEYFLSESQWVDMPALGMPAALAKLADAVSRDSTPSLITNPALGAAATPIGKRSGGAPKRVMVAVGIFIVTVGAVVLAIRFWQSKHTDAQGPATAQISERSIAVLPFADMSQKKDQEYFGDGMAEEILDLLARIPGLKVIGRTSSFEFKGKNEDLRTIGKKLNAAYVLEGSVRNSGDQVRVTAQLINAKTGAHEWSETYDRPIGDVLKLEDAIAAGVVRELQLTVDPGNLVSRSTLKSPETYDLILRGRRAADRWDEEGLDEAITLLKQAMSRDAMSADAMAELAFAYYKQGADGFVPPVSAFESARRAAATALGLDAKSARAHYVLGKIHIVYDWDWAAAEREFNEAATLAPGSVGPVSGKAYLSMALGRWDDGVRHSKAALALDPLDANSFEALGTIQWGRGHLPESEAALRRALEIRPTYAWGHYYLGRVLLADRNPAAALAEVQQETTEEARQAGMAMVYFALGRKADSDAELARMIEQHPKEYAFYIANVYAFRMQPNEVVQWLERAYAQKDPYLVYVKAELQETPLGSDPRFKAFLRKMNLPQ